MEIYWFIIGIVVTITVWFTMKFACWYYRANHNDTVQTLVRQIARWTIAAKQDNNPVIATLHANYAAGYLWALKDLVPESSIDSVTNYRELEKEVLAAQTEATSSLTKACPGLVNNGDLYTLAGDR